MCLRCQSNTFDFLNNQISIFLKWVLVLIISFFSKDTNIFPHENLNSFFTECNSIETPFKDSDEPLSVDSIYYGINDFSKLNINKNSSFAILHLNIAPLLKHFEDFKTYFYPHWNVLLILLAFWNIKLTKQKSNKCWFSSHGGTGFFISDRLTFKQRPDLLSNKPGRLESTFIELIFPNKRNVIYNCIYKHPSLKISRF